MEEKIKQAKEAKRKAAYYVAMSLLYPSYADFQAEDLGISEQEYTKFAGMLRKEAKRYEREYQELMSVILGWTEKHGVTDAARELYKMPDKIEIGAPETEAIKLLQEEAA